MFEVPNVNISYKIPEVNGYFATPASGYVLVSNGTYIINVQFSNAYAYLTFNEKGLFSNTSQNKADGSFGMHWSMSATNTGSGTTWTASSDSSQIKFWLPLGTYTYTASPVTGFSVSVGGTVSLSSTTIVYVTYTLTAVPTQTGIKNYYLNLYEVGLPAGTSWSLAITNSTSSNTSLAVTSTSALILVTKPNGTYYVRVLDSGTMSPNPAEYLLTVNGANASKTVVFSSALHWVNFTERNLPAGQKWGVIIEGINNSSIEYSTTYRDLAVQLPNGSYFYRVVTLANNVFSLTNSSGFIVVPGAKLFNVSFTSYQYLLTFTESALPAGTPWSVLINEPDGAVLQISTSQTSVSTYLPNGTYLYVPTTSVNYRASPSESTLHIGGQASSTFAITFISNLYKLSFVESGLPTGRFWNVAITDGSGNVQSYFSDTGYLNVSLLNGTYSYKIYNSSTYIPSPSSGTVNVSGTPAAENIQFTRYAWNLAFNETGLNGTVWNVTVTAPNGTIYSSSSNLSQIVFNLTNGTYTYTINSANKTWTTTTTYGSSTILGSTQYVNVNFSEVLYSVSFKVTGLPTNTTWGVTFNGENYSTNTTYINITLPNGTYSYVVKTINDYTVAPINGTIHLKGGNQTASITYSKKTTPPPPPVKSGSYSAYIVVGVLIGLGAVGLGIIFVLYYQR